MQWCSKMQCFPHCEKQLSATAFLQLGTNMNTQEIPVIFYVSIYTS